MSETNPGQITGEKENCTAAVVAEIVQQHLKVQGITIEAPRAGQAPLVFAAAGLELIDAKAELDKYLTAPERRCGVATMLDLTSFVAHVRAYSDPASALFATRTPPALLAVYNYNHPGEGAPRFGDHRARYDFPLSDEWKAWTENASPRKTSFDQASFAEFVENRIVDVIDPADAGANAKKLAGAIGGEYASPSRLLDLSRGLSVHVGARVRGALNLSTGETQINYATEHTDEKGAPLRVPTAFLIGIPVFRDGALYQIPVRLRYRVREGVVTWFYELYRAERSFDDAFKEALTSAAALTELPLYQGSPEV